MAAPLDASAPPADSAPAPIGDLGNPSPTPLSTVTLTADQLAGAGLDGLQPGDNFTVTISGTVTDNTDGISADVTMASHGEKSMDEPGGDRPPDEDGFSAPSKNIEMGPGAMKGF